VYQPYGYAGAYTLNHTGEPGILSLAARETDPVTTSFTTPDTAKLLTRYGYTPDPVNTTDPTGRTPEWLTSSWLTQGTAFGLALVGMGLTIPTGGAPLTQTVLFMVGLATGLAVVPRHVVDG
jgi:RHS repeat-associated protein